MNRYQRQVILPEWGEQAQERMGQASVLVVGAGGLGCPVLTYLAAAGVGHMGVVDADTVELSNLHRQPLYAEGDVGKSKALVAKRKLLALNTEIEITAHDCRLGLSNAMEMIAAYDLVVDGSDNFATRYLVADASFIQGKPLVFGAIDRWGGQLSVFNKPGGPTYRCLFPEDPGADALPSCEQAGVMGVLPGMIGTAMALEAIKLITGLGESLSGRLALFDALNFTWREVTLRANPAELQRKKLEDTYGSCTLIAELDVHKRAAWPAGLKVVDVREVHEKPACEFADMRCPLSEWDSAPEIEASAVAFICQSGVRSRTAAERFSQLHPGTRVWSVAGGLNALKG